MRILKGRRGFSLVELLIAVVVLGILTAIVVNGGAAAQERARVTSATTTLNDYRTAFSASVLASPGIMKDREEAWLGAGGTGDGSTYTSHTGMARLVRKMNERLQPAVQFFWWPATDFDGDGNPDVDAPKVWRTKSEQDPWGGYYILTEYPEFEDGHTPSYFDPTAEPGLSSMCIGIWATGKDEGIVSEQVVSKNSRGICLVYKAGVVSYSYQGIDSDTEAGAPIDFVGAKIVMK